MRLALASSRVVKIDFPRVHEPSRSYNAAPRTVDESNLCIFIDSSKPASLVRVLAKSSHQIRTREDMCATSVESDANKLCCDAAVCCFVVHAKKRHWNCLSGGDAF